MLGELQTGRFFRWLEDFWTLAGLLAGSFLHRLEAFWTLAGLLAGSFLHRLEVLGRAKASGAMLRR